MTFFATWCGPCKVIAPQFEVLAEHFQKIKFFKLDIDNLEDIAEKENVSSLPTFKVYVDGKIVKTIVGASVDKIRSALNEVYEIQNWGLTGAAAALTATTTTASSEAPAASVTAGDDKQTAATPAPAANSAAAGTGTVTIVESEAEFAKILQKPLVVVDFYAEWCGPCKQLAPFFKTLAAEYKHVNFIKIDYDDFESIAEQYDVASLPTLVFFKDGKKVHTHVGVSKDKITQAFKDNFAQQ